MSEMIRLRRLIALLHEGIWGDSVVQTPLEIGFSEVGSSLAYLLVRTVLQLINDFLTSALLEEDLGL